MTTKKDEVRSTVEALSVVDTLKLALEALEECRRDPRLKYEHPYYDKTITAIREALNTSPPASKPLTDEQIMEMYNEPRSDAEMVEFARAIERAHGIKEKNE